MAETLNAYFTGFDANSVNNNYTSIPDIDLSHVAVDSIGSLRYRDYGLRTTAERALSFVCSTGLSRANIER